MQKKVFVYDPTASDTQSAVRGIGRYLQILKENFPNWIFDDFPPNLYPLTPNSLFINPFFNFLQPPLTLKRIAQRQIAVIHDLIPLKYPSHFPAGIRGGINIALNKFALRNYDLIITDSEASKTDIIDLLHLEDKKIKVISPCLPDSFSKFKIKNSDLNENLKLEIKNYCLYVGDATWNKNLVNLARAIKIANVPCVFVGKVFKKTVDVASEETLREADCPAVAGQSLAEEECHEQQNLPKINHPWQKELKDFYALTKDDKRFIFAGFVPDSELYTLYEQASVNLLLSSAEGFGFSYLEAANFSCPSLLSDIPVLNEISAGNALFADPSNPQAIADKIDKIYFDKTLRNKVGSLAKKRSEFFSAEKFKEEFLNIVND